MGDLFEVDLNMQTVFGLAHIQPISATLKNSTTDFVFQIFVLANIDFNKDNAKDLKPDYFRGNDNLHDSWNWTLDALNMFQLQALKGDVFDKQVQMQGAPIASPFKERFENVLAGWEMTINLTVPNETPIC